MKKLCLKMNKLIKINMKYLNKNRLDRWKTKDDLKKIKP